MIRIGFFAGCAFPILAFLPLVAEETAESPPGAKLYRQHCAECHGDRGQGVPGAYDEALYGDRTIAELSKIIDETMPEEEPELVTGEDARTIAAWMHSTFYTAEARAQGAAPRVELSRLTTPQYQTVVADLGAHFLGYPRVNHDTGLKATYYKERRLRNDKKAFERNDARIDFDFGDKSPAPDKIGAEQFGIKWEGAIRAPETGDYDFVVESGNGFRLYVNDHREPLIDGWVSSGGKKMKHTARVRLLGGRVYPLRLEYFKYKDKAASIALKWRPPHKVVETIPARNLSPHWAPPTLVVSTDFPPDDGSVGYERGTLITKSWDEATTAAAIEVANQIADNLPAFAKTTLDDAHAREKLRDFCRKFSERALRRPLSAEDQAFYVDRHFAGADDLQLAVKKSILLTLKSPRFLYVNLEQSPPDAFDRAARLSFALWDSIPDETLWRAAADGRFDTGHEIVEQADRMANDPRARAKLHGFFQHWLQIREVQEIMRDDEKFPGFDQQLVADLRTSLELFVDDVFWSERSDFRELLLAEELYVNRRLSDFYGIQAEVGEEFEKASTSSQSRAGVLTHPYMMAMLSYFGSTSPIHRGVFVTRKLLSRALKPPPQAIEFKEDKFDPNLSMREKVAKMTSPTNCQTCHSIINPLGFSLEHFDAVGRYRQLEGDRPVDASAEYPTPQGESASLDGSRSLAQYILDAPAAREGFVEHLFHHAVKQPAAAFGPDTLQRLHQEFVADEFHMRRLLTRIAATAAAHDLPAEH